MSIKLLCDPVTHNPGDLAIGEVELEFFRKHGLEIEPVGPDFAGSGPFIIGGGAFRRGLTHRGSDESVTLESVSDQSPVY